MVFSLHLDFEGEGCRFNMEDYSVSDVVDDGWELFITQKTPEHVPEDVL